jgi:hypothetical protein
MTSVLIALMLAAAAFAIILFVRRRPPTPMGRAETDTAWSDPVGQRQEGERPGHDDGTR